MTSASGAPLDGSADDTRRKAGAQAQVDGVPNEALLGETFSEREIFRGNGGCDGVVHGAHCGAHAAAEQRKAVFLPARGLAAFSQPLDSGDDGHQNDQTNHAISKGNIHDA